MQDETQSYPEGEQPEPVATPEQPEAEAALTEVKVEEAEDGQWHVRAYDQNGEPLNVRSQDGFSDKDAAMAWVTENITEPVPVQIEARPTPQPADGEQTEGHIVADGTNVEIHPPVAEGVGAPTEEAPVEEGPATAYPTPDEPAQ